MHIGSDVFLRNEMIVGMFDLDGGQTSDATRNFLALYTKNGKVDSSACAELLPKSIILTTDGRIFISPISTKTLAARL